MVVGNIFIIIINDNGFAYFIHKYFFKFTAYGFFNEKKASK